MNDGHAIEVTEVTELQYTPVAYSSPPASPHTTTGFLTHRHVHSRGGSSTGLVQDFNASPINELTPQNESFVSRPRGLTSENIANNECETSAKMRERIRKITEDHKIQQRAKGFFRIAIQNIGRWYNGVNITRKLHLLNIMSRAVHSAEKGFGSGIANFFDFMSTFIYINFMIFICCFFLLCLPWLLQPASAYAPLNDWKIILGLVGYDSAVIGQSWFFYGGYPESVVIGNLTYSFTFFYCFCIMLYFLLSMLTITIALGIRLGRESGFTNQKLRYVNQVFNTWDWGVQHVENVEVMKQGIASKLSEFLAHDENEMEYTKVKTRWQKILMYTRRAIGILISLVFIVGAPASAGFITNYYETLNSYFGLLTSILNAIINVIFPLITTFCVTHIERYKDARVINGHILIRTYIIKMSTTIAVIVRVISDTTTGENKCRSNEAGLLYWQMILIDFVVTTVLLVVINLAKYFIGMIRAKRKDKEDNSSYKLEFDISGQVMGLLYRQTVIWVGSIMSPMLPLIGVLSNFILFFLTFFIMKATCKFPENPEVNGRNSFFSHAVVLFTLVICLIPAFAFMLQPSDLRCGPYASAALNFNSTTKYLVPGVQDISAYTNRTVPTPVEIMAIAWINNPVFTQNSSVLYWWVQITYYVFHPLTLFVIATGLLAGMFFINQRRVMHIKLRKKAEEAASIERKEKMILLRESGFVL